MSREAVLDKKFAYFHLDDALASLINTRFGEEYPEVLTQDWIEIVLFDDPVSGAPLTVENFEQYISSGQYVDIILHRLVPNFILQGGGFQWLDSEEGPKSIEGFGNINNEFSEDRSNTRGTIAMAKLGGNPDSATSQWFFNLSDNSQNLDNQNGGFTVFGEANTQTDLLLLDILATTPTVNAGGAFGELPVYGEISDNQIEVDDVLRFKSIEIVDDLVDFNLDTDDTKHTESPVIKDVIIGDANNNGSHDVSDAVFILRTIVNLESELPELPGVELLSILDVDQDGTIG